MKNLTWRFGLAATCMVLMIFGRTTPVFAADQDRGGPADRLDRLERRMDEMSQRQEQLMRRLGEASQRRAPMAQLGRERLRRQMFRPERAGIGQPTPPHGAPGMAGVPAAPGPHPEVAKPLKDLAGLIGLCVLIGIVFNILLAIWIYLDIRKRGEGSGIFIALALLAGIPAAIIYSIVRIADKKT
jgi:hypothetical protein